VIRGDVVEYTLGNSRARIVIVSARASNPRRATYLVVLGADVPTPESAALVPTTVGDPTRGSIDASRLRPLVPENVSARVGRMSRTTMERVDEALGAYLGL
jgi:mRNA-degrading endonuclease toxin of MazEF toxin-antitoxin module